MNKKITKETELTEIKFSSQRFPYNVLKSLEIVTVGDIETKIEVLNDAKGIGAVTLMEIATNPDIIAVIGDDVVSKINVNRQNRYQKKWLDKRNANVNTVDEVVTKTTVTCETHETEVVISQSGILVTLSPEEAELLTVILSMSMSTEQGVVGTRESILNKINKGIELSKKPDNDSFDEFLPSKYDSDVFDIIRWINDGIYRPGYEIKSAVKRYIAAVTTISADDENSMREYDMVSDFSVSYVNGINTYPMSSKFEYKLIEKDGKILPIKRKEWR